MTATERREEAAWRTIALARQLAKEARDVGLDTMAYLLEMVVLEAQQHVVMKGE